MESVRGPKIEVFLDPELDREIEKLQLEATEEFGKPLYTKEEQVARMAHFGIIAYKKSLKDEELRYS